MNGILHIVVDGSEAVLAQVDVAAMVARTADHLGQNDRRTRVRPFGGIAELADVDQAEKIAAQAHDFFFDARIERENLEKTIEE